MNGLTKKIYNKKFIGQRNCFIIFILLVFINVSMNVYEPGRDEAKPNLTFWTFLWILLAVRSFYLMKIIKLEIKILSLKPYEYSQDDGKEEKEPQDIKSEYLFR